MELFKSEDGTVIVLVALLLVIFLGFMALVIDVGFLYLARFKLENDLDAVALAGVQKLPEEPGEARQVALDYAVKNQLSAADLTIEITENDHQISVRSNKQVPMKFATVFGIDQVEVAVSSKAKVGQITATKGVVPFGVVSQDFTYGEKYYLRYGSGCDDDDDDDHDNDDDHGNDDHDNDDDHGNDDHDNDDDHGNDDHDNDDDHGNDDHDNDDDHGNDDHDNDDDHGNDDHDNDDDHGNDDHDNDDDHGNDDHGNDDHDNDDDNCDDYEKSGGRNGNFGALALGGRGAHNYEENLEHGYEDELEIGEEVTTEPGNMAGPTTRGVRERLDECQNSCTYDSVKKGCSRLVFVPVIDDLGNGRSQAKVVGFAAFFVEGLTTESNKKKGKKAKGQSTYVEGRFISWLAESGEMGSAGTDYHLRTVKLVE